MPSTSRTNLASVQDRKLAAAKERANNDWARPILLAGLIANAMTMTIAWDPFSNRGFEPFSMFVIASIFVQSCLLTLPGLLLTYRYRALGWFAMAIPLLIVMIDAAVYRTIGTHVISDRGLAAVSTMPQWISHAGWPAWRTLISIAVGFTATYAACIALTNILVERFTWKIAYGIVAFVGGATLITLFSAFHTRVDIGRSPFQHPLSIAGIWRPVPITFSDTHAADIGVTTGTELEMVSAERAQRERAIRLIQTQPIEAARKPDVVIVVVESFRHELVDAQTMPHLHDAANRGLWCRNHYSSGNATSHGMFSLVSGMDATWFSSKLRYRPPMFEIFRDAGYHLGFFAGHDDWQRFYMDSFISEDHFDVFEFQRQDGLASDRWATAETLRFLDRQIGPESSPQTNDSSQVEDMTDSENFHPAPRLAILYLYATHSPYRSYAEDQIFDPSAEEDFPIPYGAEDQLLVWNRYRNSAHTVDRWLKLFFEDDSDRIVVVLGDHGEAFLEDGTIGHGTRISRQQNMTPAILFGQGIPVSAIEAPTMHADILPTLVDLIGLDVSGIEAIDGVSLLDNEAVHNEDRSFVTRDYLTSDTAAISVSEVPTK
ncbi:Sulfatase [Rubripirellula amarantea]|uniref:Sulfatase n=1 Tax=Rubripirellula amarantea TaxID=2527999 RepID=A0A5C5WKI1_9BACT|nr:sulfatase-like hydrolase/transferase [Rubripirellula amarantea]TWT51298.1 Sulfatase [Rubripirellula amarantea]